METLNRYTLLFVFLFLPACSDLIEYSPYDADFSAKSLNLFYTENMNPSLQHESDTLTFAFLSDSHFYYDKLASAVKSINTKSDISFVAICGDITDSGMAREYEYYLKQVRKLRFPFVTVIGNHDYLSNGNISFKRMFGESNFSFTCGTYKFIVFNSVVWENNNKSPDFDWLKNEVGTRTRGRAETRSRRRPGSRPPG
jgi:predicted MPP superfamily phosphohydrolase